MTGMGSLEHDASNYLMENLGGEGSLDDGDDHVAMTRASAAIDEEEITREHPNAGEGFPGGADHEGGRRVPHEALGQVEAALLVFFSRRWKSTSH